MRKMIWLGVAAAALWCVWWLAASFWMERSIANWFDTRRAEGWQAEVQEISKAGFPLMLHSRVSGIAVADPETGIAVSASHFDIKAAAYWPGHVTVNLPETPIQLFSPDGALTLEMTEAQANLRLHPGTSLVLESMISDAASWRLGGPGGDVLSAQTWHLSMQQSEQAAETYAISMSSEDLTPGDLVRSALQIPTDWPLAFDAFKADMTVRFDRPWDRSALSERRPQPRALTLRTAQADWGKLKINTTADLLIDETGTPTGTATLRAENWREALTLATSAGALAQSARTQVETMLSMLAGLSGDPETLDIEVTFEDGQMRLGFIPLGAAPTIGLR